MTAQYLQILSFCCILKSIFCQYSYQSSAYPGNAIAASNAYQPQQLQQQQQPYAGQYPGAAAYPSDYYPTNAYPQAIYPQSNPTIPTVFPQYPNIYPENPQNPPSTYNDPNDQKCPAGWKKDGNCKRTGICMDRKENCFYGAICCQIDSKSKQKTTKQNPKTGKMETDWCPIYSYKDGKCGGKKFFCADPSEVCVQGDCCEKNPNIPSVPTNPTYPGQTPTYPGQNPTYPGQAPTYPGQNPTYPGQAPTYPGQNPAYPTYPGQNPAYPTYPGQNPAYPTYPGQAPTYPGQNPAYPTYPGQNPAYPTYPGQNPSYPGQNPAYPTYPGQMATYPSQNPTAYPGQTPTTYPGQNPSTYPSYPTTGGGYSPIAGINPTLLQQACAMGDEQLCVTNVISNPTICSDMTLSQTCPTSCGLCNSLSSMGAAYGGPSSAAAASNYMPSMMNSANAYGK